VKNNILILVFVLITSKMIIFSSQLRISALSGIGNYGSILVPDLWCDSFFVNPAYAGDCEKSILNIDNGFNFINKSLVLYQSFGILKPGKNNSVFGFKISNIPLAMRFREYDIIGSYNSIYSASFDEVFPFYADCDFLKAWKINNDLSLGFNIGLFTKSVKNIAVYIGPTFAEAQFTFGLLNNYGYLINSLSFPLKIAYSYKYNIYYGYYYSNNYWMTDRNNLSINPEINENLDFKCTKDFSIRIPISIGLNYEIRNDSYSFSDRSFTSENEKYFYNNFEVYFKTALSFINKIDDKAMIFYGFETLALKNFYSYNTNPSIRALHSPELFNFKISTFFGTEIYAYNNYLTVRLGINSQIFMIKYEELPDIGVVLDKNEYLQLSSNIILKSGVSINPNDLMSIEFNTNFSISFFRVAGQSIYYYNYNEENFNANDEILGNSNIYMSPDAPASIFSQEIYGFGFQFIIQQEFGVVFKLDKNKKIKKKAGQ
jgi:hypothetical protein